MIDGEPTITLRAGDAQVDLYPDAGARVGQITVGGQPLLIDVPAPAHRRPMGWGSYAMLPWAGRLRGGRFGFRGVDHQLPINHRDGDGPERAHAIHGLAFDRPWQVLDVSETWSTCAIGLDWEFGGIARQTVSVGTDRVTVELVVESGGSDFPAEVGWHPWFRKPSRLEFSPTAMYQRDRFGLPTGELVAPSEGPWDDCFVATGPIVVHFDRQLAPSVSIGSDCDHWVIYSEPEDAICVEPQSGPPDAFNLSPLVEPHVVTSESPLRRTMTISW